MLIALVDADIIAHQSANAADGRTYKVGKFTFKYKSEAEEFCLDFDEPLDSIALSYNPEPVENALRNCKLRIEQIKEDTGCTDLMLFLSDSTNFRYEIATTKPYKSSRQGNRKPEHLDACKQYLQEIHGAQIADDAEADDYLGIEQMNSLAETIICTIDKDLKMIPGRHYNWQSREFTEVNELEALRHFYKQVAMGDSIDDIEGIPGCGPKCAEALVKDAKTEKEMYLAVLDAYVDYFWNHTSSLSFDNDDDFKEWCQYSGERRMYEMGQLLWIQRNYGERWIPPTFTESERNELPIQEDKS